MWYGEGLLVRESFSLDGPKNSLDADRRLWCWIIAGRPWAPVPVALLRPLKMVAECEGVARRLTVIGSTLANLHYVMSFGEVGGRTPAVGAEVSTSTLFLGTGNFYGTRQLQQPLAFVPRVPNHPQNPKVMYRYNTLLSRDGPREKCQDLTPGANLAEGCRSPGHFVFHIAPLLAASAITLNHVAPLVPLSRTTGDNVS